MASSGRTFRLVCDEKAVPIVESLLESQGFSFENEPFYSLARKVVTEPFPLGESLAARFGLIYIQDRSSMLPPLTLDPPKGASVLDMCSAPGSKTSLLSRLVGRDGFVFASEPSADRLGTLRANLRRTSSVNTATTKSMAQDLPFPDNSWDYIQLDPPCSGWGTVDKNPKVMELWGESKTAPLVSLQKMLLEKAADMLRPGGSVLYSTCTTNIEENEEQIAWVLETLNLELEPLAEPKGFVFGKPYMENMDGVLRVSEDSEGQGFFLARFRKRDDESAIMSGRVQEQKLPGEELDLRSVSGGELLAYENFPQGKFFDFNGKVIFLHHRALEKVPGSVRWQGFPVGKIAGRGPRATFRPGAMARALLPAYEENADLDKLLIDDVEPLERMLTGQSLSFKKGKGPVGLYFRGLPLGWLSRKGSRLIWTAK